MSPSMYLTDTRRWHNVGRLLARRLRRRPNSGPTLGQRIVSAGYIFQSDLSHGVSICEAVANYRIIDLTQTGLLYFKTSNKSTINYVIVMRGHVTHNQGQILSVAFNLIWTHATDKNFKYFSYFSTYSTFRLMWGGGGGLPVTIMT